MTEIFKIMKGVYDKKNNRSIIQAKYQRQKRSSIKTLKAKTTQMLGHIHKQSTGVVEQLPDHLISTNKLRIFERGLDKHQQTQPLVYVYKTELNLKTESRDYTVKEAAEGLDIEAQQSLRPQSKIKKIVRQVTLELKECGKRSLGLRNMVSGQWS